MLFTADAWPRIADGSTTVTFRRWTRPQAKPGGRYRVGGMLLEATAVAIVDVGSISEDDARAAGERDRDALLARLGDTGQVWRVDFRLVGPDDRIARQQDAEFDADSLAALRSRLQRLDGKRPWTMQTLRLIDRYPGEVSTILAGEAGMARMAFKQQVRKLKELGLTESLTTGYRLSPRGSALLRALSS